MGYLGIISGTLLQQTDFFHTLKQENVKNEYGGAIILRSGKTIFIARHGLNVNEYILPHRINHQANLKALKDAGADEVISFNSTGSLKLSLEPGTMVVPDDFIMPFPGPTIFTDKPVHITPTLCETLRLKLLETVRDCKLDAINGGVYWQTTGPRLETRAEIRMMAHFADIVGMTVASEAIIARELDLSYAAICSVDNYAHGVVKKAPTMNEINENARKNAVAVLKIIDRYKG